MHLHILGCSEWNQYSLAVDNVSCHPDPWIWIGELFTYMNIWDICLEEFEKQDLGKSRRVELSTKIIYEWAYGHNLDIVELGYLETRKFLKKCNIDFSVICTLSSNNEKQIDNCVLCVVISTLCNIYGSLKTPKDFFSSIKILDEQTSVKFKLHMWNFIQILTKFALDSNLDKKYFNANSILSPFQVKNVNFKRNEIFKNRKIFQILFNRWINFSIDRNFKTYSWYKRLISKEIFKNCQTYLKTITPIANSIEDSYVYYCFFPFLPLLLYTKKTTKLIYKQFPPVLFQTQQANSRLKLTLNDLISNDRNLILINTKIINH